MLAATADRAWVKVNDTRTVIVNKGDSLPGLGAYLGTDSGTAKFDSKTIPITSKTE